MAQAAEKSMNAKEAIDSAFSHFHELFTKAPLRHILLEGLRYDVLENQWIVTIGFDAGREKKTGGQMTLFSDTGREPIREFRIITLDATDGGLIEIDHE